MDTPNELITTNCKIQNTIGLGLGYTYMCIILAVIVFTSYFMYSASQIQGGGGGIFAMILPYICCVLIILIFITVCMLNMSSICKWDDIVGWPLILFALVVLGYIIYIVKYYTKPCERCIRRRYIL
jgi:amino acid permease